MTYPNIISIGVETYLQTSEQSYYSFLLLLLLQTNQNPKCYGKRHLQTCIFRLSNEHVNHFLRHNRSKNQLNRNWNDLQTSERSCCSFLLLLLLGTNQNQKSYRKRHLQIPIFKTILMNMYMTFSCTTYSKTSSWELKRTFNCLRKFNVLSSFVLLLSLLLASLGPLFVFSIIVFFFLFFCSFQSKWSGSSLL